jgi:hypothetical protein
MNDRDGNRSNPYHPDPKHCCEACIFNRGEHAEWCLQSGAESVREQEILLNSLDASMGPPPIRDEQL